MKDMQRTVRNVCGYLLIAAGVAGFVLPIIPGIPLLLGGAALLGSDHALVRRCTAWLRKRGLLKGEKETG
jgi:uncharacterized membrane protein YbaN (DUF454 family)